MSSLKRKGRKMKIGVVNHSEVMKEKNILLSNICSSITKQIMHHAAPAWGRLPISVSAYRSDESIPEDVIQLALFDDADQAGALGYHSETPQGKLYGKVFVKTILDNDGSFSSGPNSISVTLSHEALEIFGDPFVNVWVDMPDGLHETPLELCDAVEGDSYDIDGIAVSNFLFPAWFDDLGKGQLDQMNLLHEPFTMTSGGYMVLRKSGKVTTIFASYFERWKIGAKDFAASRTHRRRHRSYRHLLNMGDDADMEITKKEGRRS